MVKAGKAHVASTHHIVAGREWCHSINLIALFLFLWWSQVGLHRVPSHKSGGFEKDPFPCG